MLCKLKFFFIKNKLKRYISEAQNPRVDKSKFLSSKETQDKLDVLKLKEKTFSSTLLEFIDKKEITDVECYKSANIDRKLFSKIRSNDDYKPSKNTVFAFAIALRLDLQETDVLLASAGYSLSHSFLTDIIVEFFIKHKKYDINQINFALEDYKQSPLGSF